MSSSDADLRKELETLRVLRATLEGIKQLAQSIHTDAAVTMPSNYKVVTTLERRWADEVNAINGETEGMGRKK